MKKVLALVLSLSLVVGIFNLNFENASAEEITYDQLYDKENQLFYDANEFIKSKEVAAAVNYLQIKYPNGAKWTEGGECYGFAEKASKMFASSRKVTDFTAKKNSTKELKNLLMDTKTGCHVRFSNKTKFDGGYGHSVVILKTTEDDVYWVDNNYGHNNIIIYDCASWESFYGIYSSFKYINRITETVKYKTYSSPQLKVLRNENGVPVLYWTKVKNATEYMIYSSTEKNSGYKLIDTVTSYNYSDESAEPGYTYYYKIKAVVNNKSTTFSNTVSKLAKLDKPENVSVRNLDDTGQIEVRWDLVNDADAYKVYRKLKYVKTVKSNYFLDDEFTGLDDFGANYVIKAVKNSGKKAVSAYSDRSDSISPKLTRPTANVQQIDSVTGELKISWNEIAEATHYMVYFGENEQELNQNLSDEAYLRIVNKSNSSITINVPNGEYYFSVVAVYKNFLNEKPSKASEPVRVSVMNSSVIKEKNYYYIYDFDPEYGMIFCDSEDEYRTAMEKKKLEDFIVAKPDVSIYCAKDRTMDLNIDIDRDINGFEIYKKASADGKYMLLADINKTYTFDSYYDNYDSYDYSDNKEIKYGTKYYYKVRYYMIEPDGTRLYSDYSETIIKTGCTAPVGDIKIKATRSNGKPTKLTLSWGKVKAADGYRVAFEQIIPDQAGNKRFTKFVKTTKYSFNITGYRLVKNGTRIIYSVQPYKIVNGQKVYAEKIYCDFLY